jgi:AcrR family transcriptional regulator
MEEAGQDGFSLRKLAARVGCDPMAVLYHFGSRLGLERAMADALNAQLVAPERKRPWRERLLDLAQQYRALASRYPRTFPLLQRFWVTGPADYHHAEEVYAALAEAGFGQQGMVDACFGWYAAVLGLAAAEAGGLLRPPSDAQLAEVEGLPEADFPLTRQLLPAFRAQEPDRAFRLMVEAMLDGLERQALAQRSEPAADGAVQFQS